MAEAKFRSLSLDILSELVCIHALEFTRLADLFTFHEHALLFAEQLQSAIGNRALITIFAGRLAIAVQDNRGLHGAIRVLDQPLNDPLLREDNTLGYPALQFSHARLNTVICCQSASIPTIGLIASNPIRLILRFAARKLLCKSFMTGVGQNWHSITKTPAPTV